jgi:hypothetical protein
MKPRNDQSGFCHKAFFGYFEHFGFLMSEVEVDQIGRYYLGGFFNDQVILGQDTLVAPGDSVGRVIVHLDENFQPLWTRHFVQKSTNTHYFHIDMIDDTLAFMISAKTTFTFTGIYFSDGYGEIIQGLFDSEGNLLSSQLTETSHGIYCNDFVLDKCGNFVLNGFFENVGYFGNDTIVSEVDYENFLAKNFRFQPISLEMPPDTSACGMYTVYGPEGYLRYRWNGIETDQYWHSFYESGQVILEVTNEGGCWRRGTMNLDISNLSPAIYFIKVKTDHKSLIKKLVVY